VWVEDDDELLAAVRGGVLDLGAGTRALARTHSAVAGIAAAGYDVDRWLAGMGATVPWRSFSPE
jgi:predicted RNA-binding protein associated with RNAse of E/G family